MNLKDWRKGKGWTQGDLADKIREPRPSFQRWEAGINQLPPDVQSKIRKLGYEGPWPREEAKEATVETIPLSAYYRDMGKLEGRLETLERAFERLGEIVRSLLPASEESPPRGRL